IVALLCRGDDSSIGRVAVSQRPIIVSSETDSHEQRDGSRTESESATRTIGGEQPITERRSPLPSPLSKQHRTPALSLDLRRWSGVCRLVHRRNRLHNRRRFGVRSDLSIKCPETVDLAEDTACGGCLQERKLGPQFLA